MLFGRRDNRRRLFFIKKEFQGKFILLYALCIILPAALAVLALHKQAQVELERHLFSSHLKISDTGEIFQWLLIKTNLLSSSLLIVIVMLFSLYIFHRLNTHFFRMEALFDAMGRGDFSLKPQLTSRFNEISTFIELAEATRQDYRQRFWELSELLDQLDKRLAAGATTDELHEFSKKLSAHLSRVTLPERSSQ